MRKTNRTFSPASELKARTLQSPRAIDNRSFDSYSPQHSFRSTPKNQAQSTSRLLRRPIVDVRHRKSPTSQSAAKFFFKDKKLQSQKPQKAHTPIILHSTSK